MAKRFPTATVLSALALLVAGGCGAPNKANIELRKQNQQLSSTVDQLQRRHDADVATIQALQTTAATVPMLPEDRLADLYTTAGLKLGRLTGGYRPDPKMPADTMIKVYAAPFDQDGDPLKAAGTFHIDLFDLALKTGNRIGAWDFDLNAAKANWYAHFLLYTYVLQCPLQNPPAHSNLLLRVTFTDALTQRAFAVDRDVTVQLPPTASTAK